MYKICVFAGTTEGRELVEFLCGQKVSVTACVATEYGETLLSPAENLTVSATRLTEQEMESLFKKERFTLVVDATHPYAPAVTENIVSACKAADTEYLRLLREESLPPEDGVFVPDAAGAVEYLNSREGNVLLTTGSKELAAYQSMAGFAERVYARVLPMENSLALCAQVGLEPSHIIAMQGPFSEDMNAAMLKAVSARFMVTKESGTKGGFQEKAKAARRAGAVLVMIGRPAQKQGMEFHQVMDLLCRRYGFKACPTVTVVGIGPGSRETITEQGKAAIRQADCLIGARRMLEAVREPGQKTVDAIAPDAIAETISANPQYRRFAVVMSGDTGFFSGTKKLMPLLEDYEVTVLPGISSLSCLCAKLCTSYENVKIVSLHGRSRNIVADVLQNERVFTLVGGENGARNLCKTLTDAGLGKVQVSVGQRLSYPDEKIFTGTAEQLRNEAFESLSVVLIENKTARKVVTQGLPDSVFLRGENSEGMVPMTKSEVRAVCLAKLQLAGDSVCWDVGAGTGSVAIEMGLQASEGAVYAVEKKEAALKLLEDNCTRLGAANVTVVPGTAPEACRALPAPTHVFVGGSSGNMQQILQLAVKKNPHVRIVATAIALESVAELTRCMQQFSDTEVVSMTVARDRKAGMYHLMTGQNPIYIFTMQGGK